MTIKNLLRTGQPHQIISMPRRVLHSLQTYIISEYTIYAIPIPHNTNYGNVKRKAGGHSPLSAVARRSRWAEQNSLKQTAKRRQRHYLLCGAFIHFIHHRYCIKCIDYCFAVTMVANRHYVLVVIILYLIWFFGGIGMENKKREPHWQSSFLGGERGIRTPGTVTRTTV